MWLIAHAGFASALYALGTGLSRRGPKGDAKATSIRWFLLGSVLPDLVDKPVGRVIFAEHFQNGRIFFHTLLLLLLFLLAGLLLYRLGEPRPLFLAAGMAVHLLLDGFWAFPETFLWPFLGPFPRHPETGSFWQYLAEQLRDPRVALTELSGFAAFLLSLRTLGYDSPKKVFRLLAPIFGSGR